MYPEDFHVTPVHPIRHDVVFVDDEFAGSGDTPRPAGAGKRLELQCLGTDLLNEAPGSRRIVGFDVGGDFLKRKKGLFCPFNSHVSQRSCQPLPLGQTRRYRLPGCLPGCP